MGHTNRGLTEIDNYTVAKKSIYRRDFQTGAAQLAEYQAALSPTQETSEASGYIPTCILAGQARAVNDFIHTTALVVGIRDESYQRRYCYEHRSAALAALMAWDSRCHPSGPWIKCKGAGIDLLNPQYT